MALIFLGASQCSICGRVLEKGQAYFAWPHFIRSDEHLGRQSDSGMHEECFEKWEHREEFVELYRRAFGEIRDDGPTKTYLAVLGTSQERAEFLARLQSAKSDS